MQAGEPQRWDDRKRLLVVIKSTALRTSSDKASSRTPVVNGRSKPRHVPTPVHPLVRLHHRIGNRAVAWSVQARLQRQPENSTTQGEKPRRPELEFHSVLHFNSQFSGFSPTAEPEAGDYGILRWSVWNTGLTSAPEHMNRLTIYDARLRSGDRTAEAEVSRSEMLGPDIVSGHGQG